MATIGSEWKDKTPVWPQSHQLLQYVGPGEGGEGVTGPGPDPLGVVRRHLRHPVVVLPGAPHSDPLLSRYDVHVVSVERCLDPGGCNSRGDMREQDLNFLFRLKTMPKCFIVAKDWIFKVLMLEILTHLI